MPAETWDRIEPSCNSTELEPGLRAAVADPLWMLGRQWQFGELAGDDAGSPIQARLRTRTHRVRSYFTEGLKGPTPLAPDTPLEALVEAEPPADSIGLRAEAGVELAGALRRAGLPDPSQALRQAFPLTLDQEQLGLEPPRIRRRLELLARRGCDGRAALAAGPTRLAQVLGARGSQANVVRDVTARLRAKLANLIRTPPEGVYSWQKERLEHSFELRAAIGEREAALRAEEYPGGHLDWFDFDLDEDIGAAKPPDAGQTREIVTLPALLRFSGAPALRWWEFEEGQVRFGEMSAGPADVVRLVVAEFASVFSDDWRLIPIRLPVGSLTRVERLDVLDSFGRELRIRSNALEDQRRRGDNRVWRFFELTGDASVKSNRDPWLFVAPAAPASQHSEPLERVIYLRDEGANLAWAVEETLEAPDGRPFRRPRTKPDNAKLASTDPAQLWSYELISQTPSNWIPFIPQRIGAGPDIRLRRARMEAWRDLDRSLAGPRGRLLDPTQPLTLYEEEVPRGGLEVTRAWQWTRSSDGGTHLWVARTKRPGYGEKGSGLEADRIVVQPPDETEN